MKENNTSEDTGSKSDLNSIATRLGWFHAKFEGPNTIGNTTTFWAGFWLVSIFMIIYPVMTNTYTLKTNTDFFIWVILAMSLSIVWGYSGIFNFGQMATFGLGGYTYGIVAINLSEITGGSAIGLVSGLVVPAVIMALLGYFMFYGQISGLYVAIITLVITLMLNLIATRTTGVSIGKAQLSGANGLSQIPTLNLSAGSFSFELSAITEYYLVLVIMTSTYLGLRYLVNSYYGYIMIAIREDELRTEMFGYDIRKLKTMIFSGGAALGGLAGVLYVSWSGFIDPSMFGLVAASLPIIWITVGGRGTLLGSGIAAYFLQYTSHELGTIGSSYSYIFLGLLFILAILYFPNGVIPALHNRWVARSTSRSQQDKIQEVDNS